MSLDRFVNNIEILNSNSKLEGFVLNTDDINSLNQEVTVLTDISDNPKYRLSVESHIYNSSGEYILSEYNTPFEHSTKYSDFTFDISSLLYNNSLLSGQLKISMSFLINILGTHGSSPFTLQEVSPDRTEIKLIVKESYLSKYPSIREEVEYFKKFAGRLKSKGLLNNLVLNFSQNNIVQVVNIKVDCQDDLIIYCKLYSPLLDNIIEKSVAYISYKVLEDYIDVFTIRPSEIRQTFNVLKGPNYRTCSDVEASNETEVKTWNSLLDTDSDTSNRLLRDIFSGSKEVDLNIDFTDFKNFVQYGSATERVKNYDYKLRLIEYYDSQYKQALNSTSGSSTYIIEASNNYLNRINKVRDNFDRFENFLFNTTGSLFTHDITGSIQPNPKYISENKVLNYPTTSSQYNRWYNTFLSSSIEYDRTNYSSFFYNTPDHILRDERNSQYVTFLHMIGQHFDNIYTFVRKLTSIHQRDEHPQRGIPNELLPYYAKSLGWKIQNTRNLSDLWLYKLGTDATGSYSNPSGELLSKSHENLSHQIWRRIVNNLPHLLKTKGSTRSVRALFSIYGIPFTLISVKEYGGPQMDEENPPILSEDKFQYLLNFGQEEYIEIPRRLYSSSLDLIPQIPQTTEFRFRTDYTGSASMSLWAVEDYNDRSNILQNLELVYHTASLYGKRTYGYLKYTVQTGSLGSLTPIESTSSLLPLFDNDIWTVRLYSDYPLYSGSLFNGKLSIDVAKSSDFVDNRISISSSFYVSSSAESLYYSLGIDDTIIPTGHTAVLGGTTGSNSVRFSGSMHSYREFLAGFPKKVFDEHVLNPSSYHTNAYSSSYDELFRYYPLGLDNLRYDHSSYSYVSSSHPNQTFYGTNPATFYNFTGGQEDQYSSRIETHYRYFPSLGANNPKSNKIKFESTKLISELSPERKATQNRYDKEQKDSNRLAIVFSPTDQVNKDISNQFGPYNFENLVGDPKDGVKPIYPSLEQARDEYFKKFTRANDIGKFIEIFSLYDYSVFEQVKQLVPARANLITGVLIEPSLLERPKIERKFPSISVLNKETILKGAELNIDSNYVPTLQTTLTPPLEIEVEREKRRVNIEFSPTLEMERTKYSGRTDVTVEIEVDRTKLKVEQSFNTLSFDKEQSGVPVYDASINLSNIYERTPYAIENADVTEETITYTYKDANGNNKTRTIVDKVYKPFVANTTVIKRNLTTNDVLDIEKYGVGSFYVYDITSTEVPFVSSQLDDSSYTFYFTTIEPDIATVTSLTGPNFKEFIEKYDFQVYDGMTTIFKKQNFGGIFNVHISSSRLYNNYSTTEYFYSSSGDFVLGQTSPNMLKSPVYFKTYTGRISDYEREKNYAINKEYNAFYSSSQKPANYQFSEDSSAMSSRFKGSKLVGAGINIDSTATVTGGPVVTVTIVNENDIIVQ
jgi:hypothetical protein